MTLSRVRSSIRRTTRPAATLILVVTTVGLAFAGAAVPAAAGDQAMPYTNAG